MGRGLRSERRPSRCGQLLPGTSRGLNPIQREDGYDQVLWLDASVVAVKDISPVFEEIASTGYIMQTIGHLLGRWVNDSCLKYFKLKREDVSNWPMYGDAGFLGLDFRADVSRKFLKEWMKSCVGGAFNGSWDNHRHDMTCGSIIAHNLGMKMVEENKYLKYGFEDANKGEHTCLIGAGI